MAALFVTLTLVEKMFCADLPHFQKWNIPTQTIFFTKSEDSNSISQSLTGVVTE